MKRKGEREGGQEGGRKEPFPFQISSKRQSYNVLLELMKNWYHCYNLWGKRNESITSIYAHKI